jgi:hypothetical protein
MRKIFGPVCINGSWRLSYNEELYMYTGCRDPELKKNNGRENIRWKTSGEAMQEVYTCCVPGHEGAAGCQKMEAGS